MKLSVFSDPLPALSLSKGSVAPQSARSPTPGPVGPDPGPQDPA